jgi:hypothetical protein
MGLLVDHLLDVVMSPYARMVEHAERLVAWWSACVLQVGLEKDVKVPFLWNVQATAKMVEHATFARRMD